MRRADVICLHGFDSDRQPSKIEHRGSWSTDHRRPFLAAAESLSNA